MSLTLSNITIRKQDTKLLAVDVDINNGEVATVMGPSGVGKSTLLDVISGQLSQPFSYSGAVLLAGQSLDALPAHERHVGVLYQDPLLFEHLTVGENIAFAIPADEHKKMTKAEKNAFIKEQLAAVALEQMHDRPVQTLSGGQQARVALLRTLAAKPKAVLLDEPFSRLDTKLRAQTREWVFTELAERGLPALLVTHDIEDARAAGGQLIEI